MKYADIYNKVIRYNKEAADLSPFYTALAHSPKDINNLSGLVDYSEDHDHPLAPLYKQIWEQKDSAHPTYYDYATNSNFHSGHSSGHFAVSENNKKGGWLQHQFTPLKNGKVLANVIIGDRTKDFNSDQKLRAQIEPEEAAQYIKILGDLGHTHHWTANQFTSDNWDRENVPTEEAVNRLQFNVREHGH